MQCSGTNLACTISVPYSSRLHKSTSRLQWHSARDVATYGLILVIIFSILGQYINFLSSIGSAQQRVHLRWASLF